MADVIDFLERLGQDSTLRHATGAQLQGALSAVDPQLRAALMAGDRKVIEALVGADNVCCMVFAPLQEEEESDGQLRRSA